MTERETLTPDELNAYVDGRLPKENLARAEAWLASHAEDAAAVHAYRYQNACLHDAFDAVLDEPVPRALSETVSPTAPRRGPLTRSWRRMAASILLLAIGSLGGWLANEWRGALSTDPRETFAQSALGAHRVFVAEVRHPVEVPSSEEEHLVAWLSKRLGTPLRAPDLGERGFALVGGRLLADDSQPAAQLMYENNAGERLTLYVRGVATNEETAFRFSTAGEDAAFYWIERRFAYALAGPVSRDRLMPIANAVYRQLNDP